MERVLIFGCTLTDIELYTRPATQGKELNLVKRFIDYYIQEFLQKDQKNNLAIFVEPKIASGFPDLVFAVYSPSIFADWSEKRSKLTITDLKVMSHLLHAHKIAKNELMTCLGMPEKTVCESIKNLANTKMIRFAEEFVVPENIESIYGIETLVAVEAKLTNTKKVADQAFANTWFANESYALIDTENPRKGTIKRFQDLGIGLYCIQKDGFIKIIEPRKSPYMVSYQSLLFNEWIGRYIN